MWTLRRTRTIKNTFSVDWRPQRYTTQHTAPRQTHWANVPRSAVMCVTTGLLGVYRCIYLHTYPLPLFPTLFANMNIAMLRKSIELIIRKIFELQASLNFVKSQWYESKNACVRGNSASGDIWNVCWATHEQHSWELSHLTLKNLLELVHGAVQIKYFDWHQFFISTYLMICKSSVN